jgi:uncharacterized membrane protein
MNWYYSDGSQQKGPVSRETLESLAQQGLLKPDQLVWTEDFGSEWKTAGSVPGIYPSPESGTAAAVESTATAPAVTDPIPVYRSAPDEPEGVFSRNAILTRRARQSLKGNWGLAIGVFLIHILITQAISNLVPVIGPFIVFFISAPLTVGLAIVFLNISRDNGPEVGQFFSGFSTFWNALGVYLLTTIFILLWLLLLIIPGIIASLAYSQVYFLLADHPNLAPMDAIESSKVLMKGHKWQYFCLGLRFLGWMLLSILTLGIGLFWVIPYMQTAYAEFYLELRKHQKSQEH